MNATAIDPRLKARRVAVARALGRKRLRRILMGFGAMVLLWVLWWAAHTSLVGVRHVRVEGAGQVSTTDILSAAALAKGTPMLDIDTTAIRDRVADLPLVADVTVRRHWPSTVTITITERLGVAVTPAGDGSLIEVDRSGRFLRVVDAAPPGFVMVTGPIGDNPPEDRLPEQAWLAVEAMARVPAALKGRITLARWDETGGATAMLDTGQTVRLPDAARLGDAYVALVTMLRSTQVKIGSHDVVDLRVPNTPVICPGSPGGPCAPPTTVAGAAGPSVSGTPQGAATTVTGVAAGRIAPTPTTVSLTKVAP